MLTPERESGQETVPETIPTTDDFAPLSAAEQAELAQLYRVEPHPDGTKTPTESTFTEGVGAPEASPATPELADELPAADTESSTAAAPESMETPTVAEEIRRLGSSANDPREFAAFVSQHVGETYRDPLSGEMTIRPAYEMVVGDISSEIGEAVKLQQEGGDPIIVNRLFDSASGKIATLPAMFQTALRQIITRSFETGVPATAETAPGEDMSTVDSEPTPIDSAPVATEVQNEDIPVAESEPLMDEISPVDSNPEILEDTTTPPAPEIALEETTRTVESPTDTVAAPETVAEAPTLLSELNRIAAIADDPSEFAAILRRNIGNSFFDPTGGEITIRERHLDIINSIQNEIGAAVDLMLQGRTGSTAESAARYYDSAMAKISNLPSSLQVPLRNICVKYYSKRTNQ